MNVTKEQMLETLRSGRFRQYHSAISDNRVNPTAFCCIGAMAEDRGLYDRTIDHAYLPTKGPVTDDCVDALGIEGIYLTDAAMSWLKVKGITTNLPHLRDALVYLNDTAKWSFEQIADFIEVAL